MKAFFNFITLAFLLTFTAVGMFGTVYAIGAGIYYQVPAHDWLIGLGIWFCYLTFDVILWLSWLFAMSDGRMAKYLPKPNYTLEEIDELLKNDDLRNTLTEEERQDVITYRNTLL